MLSTTSPFSLSDVGAECALLSAAAYKREWLDEIFAEVQAEDFTCAETQAVFAVISSLYAEGKPISAVSLASIYAKQIEDAGFYRGGRELTFANVLMSPPMESEIAPFLARVKEASARRAVYHAADRAMRLIQSGEASDVGYAELERVIIDRDTTAKRDLLTPEDMQSVIFNAVEARADAEERKKRVIYTQFSKINEATGGLDKNDLVILSAESGAGKSAFSMNLAYGTAFLNKRPTLYLNSEMSNEQMGLRWGSFLTKISHTALRNGNASMDEITAVVGTLEAVGKSKLYTLNMPDMRIQSVLSEIRRLTSRHGIELAIVDYIGRMDTMTQKDAREWQVMKSAAQRLKTLAEELHITVVMVAQLTADGSRLAQASYMMHEADLWLNLSRMNEKEEKEKWPWNCALNFRKARNVEGGKSILMRFNGDTLTFTDRKKAAVEMANAAGSRVPFGGMAAGDAAKGDVPL